MRVRTSIVIDDQIMETCLKVTGLKTHQAVVDYALQELLRRSRQINIRELKGNVTWEGNLDEWRKKRNRT